MLRAQAWLVMLFSKIYLYFINNLMTFDFLKFNQSKDKLRLIFKGWPDGSVGTTAAEAMHTAMSGGACLQCLGGRETEGPQSLLLS